MVDIEKPLKNNQISFFKYVLRQPPPPPPNFFLIKVSNQ